MTSHENVGSLLFQASIHEFEVKVNIHCSVYSSVVVHKMFVFTVLPKLLFCFCVPWGLQQSYIKLEKRRNTFNWGLELS